MKKYVNVYTTVELVCCFLFQFCSWGISSSFFKFFFNGKMAEGQDITQAQFILSWGPDYYMVEGFNIMPFTLPLLATIAACGIMRLYDGYYENAKPRITRYSSTIARDITLISLFSALAIFIGFLLFYLFGAVNCPVNLEDTYERSFLNYEFGDGFARKSPLAYYFIEGIYKFFLFPFFYGIFACCSYLLFKKKVAGIIVPAGYFFILTIIFSNMRSSLHGTFASEVIMALRPDRMIMMGGESGKGYPMAYPFISLIPPVIASAVFFVLGVRNEKKNG